MGEIYGGAFLTIVAADGDGDLGIPGISKDRVIDPTEFHFGEQTLIPFHHLPVDGKPISETEYETRG